MQGHGRPGVCRLIKTIFFGAKRKLLNQFVHGGGMCAHYRQFFEYFHPKFVLTQKIPEFFSLRFS